jgi:hypothetical protein
MIESVHCPNCGVIAERHHLAYLAQVKTQCEKCDYLLLMCTRSGQVLESYAPGLPCEPQHLNKPIALRLTPLSIKPQNNGLQRRSIAIAKHT